MPGISFISFTNFVATVSVLDKEAPSGNVILAINTPWSSSGIKPVEIVLKDINVKSTIPA